MNLTIKLFFNFFFLISLLLLSACGENNNDPAIPVLEGNSATYIVTLNTTWNQDSFSTNFPSNRHFSGLVGATHNEQIKFWESGQYASEGIESVAETGSKSAFESEIKDAINSSYAESFLSGNGISAEDNQVSYEFSLTQDNSLVTLISMIAPSPDWFVGVHNFPLYREGEWISEIKIDLPVYDAGSDDGITFNSENNEPLQHDTINLLSSDLSDSDFESGVHRTTNTHIASFTFKLKSESNN